MEAQLEEVDEVTYKIHYIVDNGEGMVLGK